MFGVFFFFLSTHPQNENNSKSGYVIVYGIMDFMNIS